MLQKTVDEIMAFLREKNAYATSMTSINGVPVSDVLNHIAGRRDLSEGPVTDAIKTLVVSLVTRIVSTGPGLEDALIAFTVRGRAWSEVLDRIRTSEDLLQLPGDTVSPLIYGKALLNQRAAQFDRESVARFVCEFLAPTCQPLSARLAQIPRPDRREFMTQATELCGWPEYGIPLFELLKTMAFIFSMPTRSQSFQKLEEKFPKFIRCVLGSSEKPESDLQSLSYHIECSRPPMVPLHIDTVTHLLELGTLTIVDNKALPCDAGTTTIEDFFCALGPIVALVPRDVDRDAEQQLTTLSISEAHLTFDTLSVPSTDIKAGPENGIASQSGKRSKRSQNRRPQVLALAESRQFDPDSDLTERQRQVLELLARGWSQKQIAAHLRIDDSAVSQRIKRLEKRLQSFPRKSRSVNTRKATAIHGNIRDAKARDPSDVASEAESAKKCDP